MRSGLGLLGLGALCAVAVSASSVGGCQADNNSTGSAGPGSGGGGGGSTSSNDGGGGASTMTTTSGTGGGGGAGGSLPAVSIENITKGAIGEGVDVQLNGVVAMSTKYLVSQSQSGSCLWGVFLSDPGLAVAKEYSGILALSYGYQATTGGDGNLYCPKLGEEPAGDAFPDDVRPGDLLNVTGETSYFLLPFCTDECGDTTCSAEENECYNNMNCMDGQFKCWQDCSVDPLPYHESQVKQRQLAKVESVERVGSAPVPTPYTMSAMEILSLSSHTDQGFHNKWGGVKIRITDVSAVPWSDGDVVNYGDIVVDVNPAPEPEEVAKLQVGNLIYYRGYAPIDDYCHKSPVFADPMMTWSHIDGFLSLDACLWTLQAVDMCADFAPPSESCAGATSCTL